MEEYGLAPNETIQLHELMTLKNLCLTKSVTMSPLVSSEELKSILQQDTATTKQHVIELKELMEKANIGYFENT